MDLGLRGKTAIVTGGASNIGRGVVMRLAREGANVVIADIDERQARKAADEASALGGGGMAAVVTMDATRFESVSAGVSQVLQQFGQVDILVNNLGWDSPGLFVETKPELWDRIIALNYKTTLNLTRAVLPHMIERGSGRMVNIGSDAGRMGEFREAVYAGTKGAVIAFTKSVAREVGKHGITANVVCPGAVVPQSEEEVGGASMWSSSGSMAGVFPSDVQQKVASKYPLRRLGTAKDIADAVAFLASDCASYVTGQTISVSGGYTMA